MKKTGLKFLGLCLFLIAALTAFVACTPTEDGYQLIDYANTVYLNTEKYPELESQGLFWWGWDSQKNIPVVKKASTAEGAALVDTAKPTIIMVHGWLALDLYGYISGIQLWDEQSEQLVALESAAADTTYSPVGMPAFAILDALKTYADFSDSDYSVGEIVFLSKLCAEYGYNFGTFTYNKFATISINQAEYDIYVGGNKNFQSQNAEDATISEITQDGDALGEYSLAQFFAAEYARAMNMLPATMGDSEIRIAGHSLGGIMSVSGLRVICALADDGQIIQKQVPTRLALLDTYIGFLPSAEKAFVDKTVAWSEEPLVNNSGSKTYMSYIDYLSKRGIAIELYVMEGTTVPRLSGDGSFLKLMDYAATVVIPMGKVLKGNFTMIGYRHVAVASWYLLSFKGNVSDAQTGEILPSASAPASVIKANAGKTYIVTDDTQTDYTFTNVKATAIDKSKV